MQSRLQEHPGPLDTAAPLMVAKNMKTSLNHLPTIDGLRGIAIAFVLWHHAPFLFMEAGARPESGFWGMSAAGWLGVDLFFVISGFLITTILLRTKQRTGQLRVFWARRALRILPLAYLYLAVLGISVVLSKPWNVLGHFDGWPFYFFYLGNLHVALNGFQAAPVTILWTLAVEEQFYLLWPFVVLLFDSRRLLRICVLIALLSPLTRALIAAYPAVYVLSFCRADTLAAGAILALLLNDEGCRITTLLWCRRLTIPALLAVVAMLVPPFGPVSLTKHSPFFTVVGYSWLAIAFTLLVGASLDSRGWVKLILTNPILMYVGKLCYGFYIWHCLVGALIQQLCMWYMPGTFGFYGKVALWGVSTSLVASASWFLFEKPFLKLKRAFPHGAPQTRGVAVIEPAADAGPGATLQDAPGRPCSVFSGSAR